jgi:malate dehydrogenase
VTCANDDWAIVQCLLVSDFSREKMSATEKELAKECDGVKHLLRRSQD